VRIRQRDQDAGEVIVMMDSTAERGAPKRSFASASNLESILQSSSGGVLLAVAILGIILGLTTKDFFSAVNFVVLARSFSVMAVVGLAQMIIIGTGGMNLSVGAIGGLAGVATGGVMDALGYSPALAIPAGLCVGALCGLVNGWLITRLGVSGVTSFLVTLASGSVFTGINLGITRANPFYNLPADFRLIGSLKIAGIPLLLFLMLGLALALALMFRYLGLGRQLLALGGNITAAELSGVPINRVVITSHVLCGVLAAFAAILLTSRLGSAQPDVGKDWLLPSFAAPIIGGTSLAGGKVSVAGAVLGAILLAVISNGLVFLSIDVYWNQFIQGIIILAAVGLDRVRTISAERLERRQA